MNKKILFLSFTVLTGITEISAASAFRKGLNNLYTAAKKGALQAKQTVAKNPLAVSLGLYGTGATAAVVNEKLKRIKKEKSVLLAQYNKGRSARFKEQVNFNQILTELQKDMEETKLLGTPEQIEQALVEKRAAIKAKILAQLNESTNPEGQALLAEYSKEIDTTLDLLIGGIEWADDAIRTAQIEEAHAEMAAIEEAKNYKPLFKAPTKKAINLTLEVAAMAGMIASGVIVSLSLMDIFRSAGESNLFD